MYRKLDNDGWAEHLNKFNSLNDTTTVKDFCEENNINKSQFYYHKRRLERITEGKEPIFQAISLKSKTDGGNSENSSIKEVQIKIGNANISIPVSEANLIASIIKDLTEKC